MAVTTFDGRFVEKQVPLPERWLRGFAEAQVLATGFTLRAEVPAAEAAAFLRTLPRPTLRSSARTTRWVVPVDGRTLRPTSRPAPDAVCLPGPERLLALQQVLRHATTVRVYAPDLAESDAAAVAWVVQLPGMRLTLMLSQNASRGSPARAAYSTTSPPARRRTTRTWSQRCWPGSRGSTWPSCPGRPACPPTGCAPR